MKSQLSENLNILRTHQGGLSMVELMVAITISLLLLAGVIQIFQASRQTYTMQDGISRLQENARYVLGRLSEEISASGYLGCMESFNQDAISNNLVNQVNGYDYANPISADNNTGFDATDVLYVRFGSSGGIPLVSGFDATSTQLVLNDTDPAYNQLEQYDIMTVGDCDGVSIFMVTNDPESSGGIIQFQSGIVAPSGPNAGQANIAGVFDAPSIAPNAAVGSMASAFKTTSNTYLVGPSFSGNGNGLFVNAIAADNELIQGVEDFQVRLGVNDDTTLGADRYVEPNDLAAADWNNVVSVRIDLRLNTVDPVQAGNTIAKDFTMTVRLRNRGNVI